MANQEPVAPRVDPTHSTHPEDHHGLRGWTAIVQPKNNTLIPITTAKGLKEPAALSGCFPTAA